MNINFNVLEESRKKTDFLADTCIEEIFSNTDKSLIVQLMNALENKGKNQKEYPAMIQNFYSNTCSNPLWINFKLLKQGSDFFNSNAQNIMSILGYYSLPYCYAAADGAQVLFLSEKIRKNTTQRLIDTANFLLEVMKENAFKENGNGLRCCQNIRLRHALVRYKILKSNQWNDDWGKPINQEDMAGTNGAFSFITLRGLDKLGVFYSKEEAEAFMHLWKVIGYFMGVDENLLTDNLKEAFQLDKLIAQRNFKKSEAGIELTKSLIQSFIQNTPNKIFHPLIHSFLRFLLGEKVADILEVPKKNLKGFERIFFNSLKTKNLIQQSFPFSSNNSATHAISLQIISNSNLQTEAK